MPVSKPRKPSKTKLLKEKSVTSSVVEVLERKTMTAPDIGDIVELSLLHWEAGGEVYNKLQIELDGRKRSRTYVGKYRESYARSMFEYMAKQTELKCFHMTIAGFDP